MMLANTTPRRVRGNRGLERHVRCAAILRPHLAELDGGRVGKWARPQPMYSLKDLQGPCCDVRFTSV